MNQHKTTSFISQCRAIRQEMKMIPTMAYIDQYDSIERLKMKILSLEYDQMSFKDAQIRSTLSNELADIYDTVYSKHLSR